MIFEAVVDGGGVRKGKEVYRDGDWEKGVASLVPVASIWIVDETG